MTINVLMPALSPTMEQGKLAKWLKSEGDAVKAGDVIAEIETDKATMEVEAVDEGVLARILVPGGTENVAVNTPIAVIAGEGEDASAVEAPPPAAGAPAPPTAPQDEPGEADAAGAVAARAAAAPAAKPVSVAAPPPISATPEVPAGTTMIAMTMREALRDAMAEEMRRDPNVFIMGEEVGEYQGAYKVTQGLLQEFGPTRVRRHADHRIWLCGHRRRRGLRRPAADRRIHDLQFFDAGDRPYREFGGENTLHVGRPDPQPHRLSRAQRGRGARRRAAQPGLRRLVLAGSRAQRRRALQRQRRQGSPESGDPRTIIRSCSSKTRFSTARPRTFRRSRISWCRSARRALRGGESDVTLVSFSIGMTYALAAAEALEKEGVEAEVIDLRTLRPMDSARNHRVGEEDGPLRRH